MHRCDGESEKILQFFFELNKAVSIPNRVGVAFHSPFNFFLFRRAVCTAAAS